MKKVNFKKARMFEKMIKKLELKKPNLRKIQWEEFKNGKIVKHNDLTAW